jgi:hypothetical protein
MATPSSCPYWKRGYCVADKACRLVHNPNDGGQLQETFLSQQQRPQTTASVTSSRQPQVYHPISAVTMATAVYGGAQPMMYGYGYYSPIQPTIPASLAPKNYKTVPCRHFQRGHCMRGSSCGFRHGEEEHVNVPPTSFGHLPAELSNPLYPGRPFRVVTCRRWAQGSCTLGDRCTFKHDFENSHNYVSSNCEEAMPTAGVKRQLSGNEIRSVEDAENQAPQGTKVLKISSE